MVDDHLPRWVVDIDTLRQGIVPEDFTLVKTCTECESSVELDAVFCGICGKRVPEESRRRYCFFPVRGRYRYGMTCRKCGFKCSFLAWSFCEKCGATLHNFGMNLCIQCWTELPNKEVCPKCGFPKRVWKEREDLNIAKRLYQATVV